MRQLEGALQLVQAHHPLRVAAGHARDLFVASLLVALAGCAARPLPGTPDPERRPAEPPTAPAPSPYIQREDESFARSAEEVSGPAVIGLLNRARADLAAGQPDRAMASLETALQIEKKNPFVWQQLAAAHLERRELEDAEIVAQRSNSFARGNPYIEVENWRVIAAARQARGDTAGAERARDKVTELQDRLED